QRMRLQQTAMARRLAIEGEAVPSRADLDDARSTVDEPQRYRRRRRRRQRPAEYRQQRVQREQVLDVGQQQFLMLLLVMQSEDDALAHTAPDVGLEQTRH